jgi:hypothetical protein
MLQLSNEDRIQWQPDSKRKAPFMTAMRDSKADRIPKGSLKQAPNPLHAGNRSKIFN